MIYNVDGRISPFWGWTMKIRCKCDLLKEVKRNEVQC